MNPTNLEGKDRAGVDAEQQKCFVCNEEMVDGHWFCKIPRLEKPTVVLCSPRCALRYFDSLRAQTNADELDRATYERSVHFLVDGERP